MEVLVENLTFLTWQQVLMWLIGGVLIYLAIVKEMEPSLLLPMGFGAILVNLPNSGAAEVIAHLFELGIAGHELFPLLLFIGIGAMIDFGPLLSNPKMLLFGAAAQFGIFFTFSLVCYGWLMFRAESMKTVQLMLHQIFTNFNPSVIPQVLEGYAGIFLLVGIGYLLHMLPDRCDRWAQRFVTSLPTIVQVLLAACVIWLVMQVKSSDIQPFIYFQF